MASEPISSNGTEPNQNTISVPAENNNASNGQGIVTTEEEIEGYQIVRAILREIVDVKRIILRDVQSYCGILLDDNNRKPICRMHFNRTQKYIGFFSGQQDNGKDAPKEERLPIDGVDDIYKFAERLKATVIRYESLGTKKQKEIA